MRNPRVRRDLIIAFAIAALIIPTAISARVPDSVPSQYSRFFKHAADKRSLPEKMLNMAGFTAQNYGRSFALVAGISRYPNISGPNGNLTPAGEDVRKITEYLRTYELFDEIVVLENDDVTIGNLSYFFERYFPARLKAFPKSRFLFVYSGHGMNDKTKGYLLTSAARSVADRDNVIPMFTVRAMFQEVVDSGFHVLALVNACYSGAFFRKPFGSRDYVPRNPGAHAITAGGTNEQTWHQGDLGSGSIFFEMFFAALDGRASQESIVTVNELTAYLQRHISSFTDQTQNPLGSDLIPIGSTGGFFFYNRALLVEKGMVPPWNPDNAKAFGTGLPVAPPRTGSAITGRAGFGDDDPFPTRLNPQGPSRPYTGTSGFGDLDEQSDPAKSPSASKRSGSSGFLIAPTGSSSDFADKFPAKRQKTAPIRSGSPGWLVK
jgi:hypothetical protein